MSAVLIVTQIFALWAVIGFISFPLFLIELESTTSAVFFLQKIFHFSFQSNSDLKWTFTSHVEYVLILTIFEFLGS